MSLAKFNAGILSKIRAGHAMLLVICDEANPLQKVSAALPKHLKKYTWNVFVGLQGPGIDPKKTEETKSIFMLFQAIASLPQESVIIIEDMHLYWNGSDPMIIGSLKALGRICLETRKNMIFVGADGTLPVELKDSVTIVEYPRPNKEERRAYLQMSTKAITKLTNLDRFDIADRCSGLTESQLVQVVGEILMTPGVADNYAGNIEKVHEVIRHMQAAILKATTAIEMTHVEDLPDVGGYPVVKRYIARLKDLISCDPTLFERVLKIARKISVMLLGHPGTGKSLLAKVIAKILGVDLYRCDLGSLYGSLLGETEERARKMFSVLNGIESGVVWWDEFNPGLCTQ